MRTRSLRKSSAVDNIMEEEKENTDFEDEEVFKHSEGIHMTYVANSRYSKNFTDVLVSGFYPVRETDLESCIIKLF